MPIKDIPSGQHVKASVDPQAREALTELEALVADIAHAVWGDSERKNGMRSKLKRHSQIIHYWVKKSGKIEDVRTRLETHLQEHKDMSARDVAIETTRMVTEAQRSASRWKEIAAVTIAVIMLAGQLYSTTITARLQLELAQRDHATTSSGVKPGP